MKIPISIRGWWFSPGPTDMLELKTICDAVSLPLVEFARRFENGCR